MGQSSASIEVKVPASKCYSYIKDSVSNPRYLSVYKQLHPGRDYSGKIIDDIENRRIVIEESAVDSLTRIRHKGWTIKYDFEDIDSQNTKATITVEYGTLLAIMSAATAKLQSYNEILARVSALLAIEYS